MPIGFRLATASADFRNKTNGRIDLALAVSDMPALAAGVFTTNLYKAAPVLVARDRIQASLGQAKPWAVVINTGQANACTGELGLTDCLASCEMVAPIAKLPAAQVLPGSTGVIGARMNLDKWRAALPQLEASLGQTSLEDFARAIMTTDAFPKFAMREIAFADKIVRLAGVAKGAGMICPNMATMLSLVLCDGNLDADIWQAMFKRGVDATFNRVSVDGDTSTNDTLIGLANGASGVKIQGNDLQNLEQALLEVLHELAYMLVKDGEGATKVIKIRVRGAASNAAAEQIARTVGHSQLVKTAMFGKDPNWGRIVAAAGRAGVDFPPEELRVKLCGIELFRNGQPADLDFDALLREPLSGQDIDLELDLGQGEGFSELLASDLSYEYVKINSDYRS